MATATRRGVRASYFIALVPSRTRALIYSRKSGETRMNKNMQAKCETVAAISERLDKAQSMVVVDFKGISVEEITALRAKFRQAGVDYVVLKNTLVRRALNDKGITGLDSVLEGPSAFAFGMKDAVAPAKIITEYISQLKSEKMTIKAGIVDGQVIDVKGVKALAELPPREVLISRIMGSLNAPATNLVGVLSATLRSLVYAVDAVRKQKEAA